MAELTRLTFEALSDIDGGRLAVAFNHALMRAEADCRDRPGVDKPRLITLTMAITPQASEQGKLRSVRTGFGIKEKVPERATREYEMAAAGKDGLYYSEYSPDDVNQPSLGLVDGEKVTERKLEATDAAS